MTKRSEHKNGYRFSRKVHASWIGILFFFTLLHDVALAQIGFGARSSALNHATTALNNHTWSLFANPATVNATQKEAAFYYVRYYGLDAVSDVAATLSYPIKWGVVSGGVHTYGFDLYKETNLHLGWMMQFKQVKTAVKLHYAHIAFPSPYGSDGALGIDLGVFFPVSEKLDIGTTAININRPSIGVDAEELPQLMTVGLAYKPLDKGLILVDVLKDVRYPISTRVGVEYPLVDLLVIRAGVGNKPVNTTFGAGINYKQWNVNLSVEKHQDLGWSPGIDLAFTW
ncbi:hypothetical protein EP331_05540 [bacterium]|nr:MAG: hypothetical protein EP331_05540 [bacterium]